MKSRFTRMALVALYLLTASSVSACPLHQPPATPGTLPPAVAANSDYPQVSRARVSSIDSDGSAWFWGRKILTQVSHRRVVGTFRTTLGANANTYPFLEPDGVGGAWLSDGKAIEHVDSHGNSRVYQVPAYIYDFVFAGDHVFFSEPARHFIEALAGGAGIRCNTRRSSHCGRLLSGQLTGAGHPAELRIFDD